MQRAESSGTKKRKEAQARDDWSFTIRKDRGRLPNLRSLLSNSVSGRALKKHYLGMLKIDVSHSANALKGHGEGGGCRAGTKES